MSIPFAGQRLDARGILLSLGLLGVAGVCAATGFRWDILACYGLTFLCAWRRTEQRLLDTLRVEQSAVPTHVQIRDQVIQAVNVGILKPDEKMPTIREVAVALKINLNIVRRAYDMLTQAGVIVIQPAYGTFVAHRLPESKVADLGEPSVPAHQRFAFSIPSLAV